MYIKIALILAAFLQFGATFTALSLIKRTKYNISWILISAGFFLMAFRRLYEMILILNDVGNYRGSKLSAWAAVIISLLIFIGTIYIKQIFNLQKRIDSLRKENEARILAAIIRTEEEARQKFAKELHDGIGPLLSAIKISISAINEEKLDKNNRQIISNTDKTIDETINAVKEISNNLSPHVLINHGLHKAIKNFTRHACTSDKPDIIFSSNIENIRFDYNIEVVIYRIICELVHNSLKHANASRINIDLFLNDKQLEMIYNDNGIGFNKEEIISEVSGMGFDNINSRIKSLDGIVEIYTYPGEGFNMKVAVNIT